MERLWAPWRMSYIQNHKKDKRCLFCRVHRAKKEDAMNFVFLRTRHSIALLNLYPYTNGHVMVAPIRHVSSLEHLSREETCDLMDAVIEAKLLLDKILKKPAGYNIGINLGRVAGAGVEKHIHLHVVPRWVGDANFMTTIGGSRVISQSLQDLYRKLIRRTK
jgi:ATP adenylyltransferase